jgi:SAM-dependent methyltransferase
VTDTQIKFTDGEGYESYMGVWSRLVGHDFLDWLTPAAARRWLDVGCGNGAFTETIVQRCAPASVDGVDPAEAQLAFARERATTRQARFHQGDAMALPFPDDSFDIAVMPLVIFFVPVPLKGVAEMARVVKPGGIVTAYGWDITGGGFPYEPVQAEMEAMGMPRRLPPSPDAAALDNLAGFWKSAGLTSVETRVISAQRTFASAEDLWTITQRSPNLGPPLEAMRPDQIAELKARVARRVPADAAGRITFTGRAHAVRGRVPASPRKIP